MHKSRLAGIIIDCQTSDIDSAADFWSKALGAAPDMDAYAEHGGPCLVTSASARSKGYGKEMLDWLRDKARAAGCLAYHLDSGTQRGEAHKFYFNQGFTITSYHFSEQLQNGV